MDKPWKLYVETYTQPHGEPWADVNVKIGPHSWCCIVSEGRLWDDDGLSADLWSDKLDDYLPSYSPIGKWWERLCADVVAVGLAALRKDGLVTPRQQLRSSLAENAAHIEAHWTSELRSAISTARVFAVAPAKSPMKLTSELGGVLYLTYPACDPWAYVRVEIGEDVWVCSVRDGRLLDDGGLSTDPTTEAAIIAEGMDALRKAGL